MLMSQPRIFFAMSRDQLLPAGVSKVHPRFRTPYITTIITCVIVAVVAGFVPIQILGEMTSIGTLFAFVVVSLAVIVLRIEAAGCAPAVPRAGRPRHSGARRPVVRLPDGQPVGDDLGAVPRLARHRDGHLLVLRPHPQPAGRPGGGGARTGAENLANFLKMVGYMLLFNGFCITLLAFLTIWGVTNEALAKWRELDGVLSYVGMHINPEIADAFGLKILALGAIVAVAGLRPRPRPASK